MFVYAVLSDQKKTRGKTRMVRMLKEQRPFKFFRLPAELMKEFAKEAKGYGLLYVPIRNKKKPERVEVVVFADDAAKVQRICDNLGLDYVKAQAGEMMIGQEDEPAAPAAPNLSQSQTVQMENGTVSFEVGGFEDDFSIGGAAAQENSAENFTPDRERSRSRKRIRPGFPHPAKTPCPARKALNGPRNRNPLSERSSRRSNRSRRRNQRTRPNSRSISLPLPAVPERRKEKERKVGNALSI